MYFSQVINTLDVDTYILVIGRKHQRWYMTDM